MRWPVLAAALLIAGVRVDLRARAAGVFVAAVLAAGLGRTLWLEARWAAHEAEVAELRAAAAVLGPDDALLVARNGLDMGVLLHSHSAAYVARDRGLYWAGLFTGGNALSPRPEYAASDLVQPFPWSWRQFFAKDLAGERDIPEWHEYSGWREVYTHMLTADAPTPAEAAAVGPTIASGRAFDLLKIAPAPD